jgi:hypothetical protein
MWAVSSEIFGRKDGCGDWSSPAPAQLSKFPRKVGFMRITLTSCEGKVLQPSSLVRSSNYGQFLQGKAEAANSRIPLCFCGDLLLE